ncbi:MAG: hypothetical protein IKA38_06520 [Alistipes sp.]|nr:hypothetical protein [Alistipes sp.]
MKRFFRIFAVAALACATFVACENKFDDYDPAQQVEGAQAYFSNQNATSYTISKIDVAPITVTLMRGQSEAAISVPITLTQGEEGAFTAPAKVDFKAGSNKATLDITYDPEKLADGSSYKVTLTIGDQSVTTPYGNNEITLTVKVPEPYVLLGKALYRDDIVASAYDLGGFPEYEVEVYKNLNNPDCIYLKNLYTHKFPVSGVDIAPGFEGDTYFAVNIKDPNEVFLPVQYLGIDAGYGNMKVGTNKPGILKDNIITFPVEAFVFAEDDYKDGAWYMYANANGMFRLALPGAVLTDFSLELTYAGMKVAADNTAKPLVDVVFGADVAQISYAVVPGNIQYNSEAMAEVLAAVEEGTIELSTVDAVDQIDDEEELLQMQLVGAEALEEGIYTIVAIPVDANAEAQLGDVTAMAFYMNSVKSEVPAIKFAAALLPFTTVFGTDYGIMDYEAMAWIAQGSNIKVWKSIFTDYKTVEAILAQGATAEDIVLAYGEDNEAIADLNNKGMAGNGYTGLDAETSYVMIHYVEDLYGNSKTVASVLATDPAPEADEDTEATAKIYRKLDSSNTFELNSVKVWNK